MMNEFGRMAMDHWRVGRPKSFAQIPPQERQEFFADLGRRAQEEMESLWMRLAGDDPPGETGQQKEQRLNMARMQAREKVLAEMILLEEDPAMFEPDEPTWQDVEETAQEEADQEPVDSVAEWIAQEDPEGEGPSDRQAWMAWYDRRNQEQ
ncbi:hypothetical protein FHX37_3146 [Haloactinospora alba]|uniref:TnpV protein n=1 Tax=Haloactinospora alba TaxID=405555 RepID=A0A543NMX6_9ACTN|nr:hypothetical protein [Haloactinospora alba]TQN33147.1 hypothetical protein FHX37_3146 [Haloactinospora alba]